MASLVVFSINTIDNKTCGYTDLIKYGVDTTKLSGFQREYENFKTKYLATYRKVFEAMMNIL